MIKNPSSRYSIFYIET